MRCCQYGRGGQGCGRGRDPRARMIPAAKALLGTALIGLGCAGDAAACLEEAVAGRAGQIPFTARVSPRPFRRSEKGGERRAPILEDGIAACPGSVALRNAAVLHHLRQGRVSATARSRWRSGRGARASRMPRSVRA